MTRSPKSPYVGVGCIAMHGGRILLVREHGGAWSTPGGHLDFGEEPETCAVRETKEETGVDVSNVEFVAITNDLIPHKDRHYITIWMVGEPEGTEIRIEDLDEIAEADWFDPAALPSPRHVFFENLLSGRSMPAQPSKLPEALRSRYRKLENPDSR